jgi:hypothetical protein
MRRQERSVPGWLVAQPFDTETQSFESNIVFVGMADRSIQRGAAAKGDLLWGAARSPWNACGLLGRCAGGWSLNPGVSKWLEMTTAGGWSLNPDVRNPMFGFKR